MPSSKGPCDFRIICLIGEAVAGLVTLLSLLGRTGAASIRAAVGQALRRDQGDGLAHDVGLHRGDGGRGRDRGRAVVSLSRLGTQIRLKRPRAHSR